MQLPEDFIRYTRAMMGEERFQRFLDSFSEEVPVSIRLNPMKTAGLTVADGEPVAWCSEGYYLPQRPNFTMDPLLHAGCYYVQEASSMFVCHVLRQFVDRPVSMLDMCAAPGGKSTAAIATLPAGSTLCSNEPIRQRANILNENITKWGYPGCTVTNSYPRDIRKSKQRFDVILCDVPCSGEGMFRKDEATIREWSPQNVEKCWQLQREIVNDAWACLNDGGLLIYSTCTFNTKENEENIRWILEEFDAEVLTVDIAPEWNITGSLLPGFDLPVYRFIPGISRGEGLFLCALRKSGTAHQPSTAKHQTNLSPLTSHLSPLKVDLDYKSAIAYLRGEALTLPPDTPRGIVGVTFMGYPLGQAKNIGTRANNLYPKEWRIRTTHIPNDYEPILLKQI
jgi:16S rRNA C967 or C1407 C5-methylase (RsmB/RsmF family)